ncbi:MAG TPA: beta-ketoacyl synthase chain length factor [Burkholderiales bacterium]
MMEATVLGIGIFGPGLAGWASSAALLGAAAPYRDTALPALEPALLPATERRRAGRTVQLAVHVAQQAMQGVQADSVPTVFATSGGDLQTAHELCLALAQPEKMVSPTRFHNSVHNAAAGYWSIATGSRAPSTSISAYDSTFAAGLLEALCQAHAGADAVLLVAYDCPAPEPLHAKRPLPAPFGVSLLLSARAPAPARGRLRVSVEGNRPATELAVPELEALRRQIPAARSLPLLSALARSKPDTVALDYLETMSLKLEVRP